MGPTTVKAISATVQEGRVLISDGAWGTELHKLGLKPGECPELWCLQRRDAVLQLVRSYIDRKSTRLNSSHSC